LKRLISTVKGIKNFGRRTGRAEGDEARRASTRGVIVTSIRARAVRAKQSSARSRARMERNFPSCVGIEQPLAHMLSHMLSGVNAQVAIKIYGPDLDILRQTAKEVARR